MGDDELIDECTLEQLEIVGRGGSGVVRRWFDPYGMQVAMKVIALDLDPADQERILQSIRELFTNNHPTITAFYGVQYYPMLKKLVIATEFMDMLSLKHLMEPLGPENAKRCIPEVLRALVYLHKERIPHVIHRDIKPSNILVNSEGQIKIGDFALSAVISNTFDGRQTMIGAYTYMSPERVSGVAHFSNSDVWSLGISLMECALGRFPYCLASNTFIEMVAAIVDGPPPQLPKPTFSDEFCQFVAFCCEPRSERRPQANDMQNHPFVQNVSPDAMLSWLREIGAVATPSFS